MLDVDSCGVGARAEFVLVMDVDVLSVDYVGLVVSPVVGFEVVVEFFLVGPHELVLIDFLASAEVLEYAVVAVVLAQFLVGEVLPVVGLEGRAFDVNSKLVAHL